MKKILLVLFMFSTLAHADNQDKFNFRFSPINAIVGSLSVDFDIAIAPQWTIGPRLSYWSYSTSQINSSSTDDYNVKTSMLGARANWFLNGNYTDGLYVSPNVNILNVTVDTTGTNKLTGKASATILSCLVGYGWFWNSFNQMLGAGLNSTIGTTKIKIQDSSGNQIDEYNASSFTGVAIEYTLGWTF